MTPAWLIEYQEYSRPSWIAEEIQHNSFGVTFNPLKAKRFTNGEDARNEILRLGLSSQAWRAVERILPG